MLDLLHQKHESIVEVEAHLLGLVMAQRRIRFLIITLLHDKVMLLIGLVTLIGALIATLIEVILLVVAVAVMVSMTVLVRCFLCLGL